MRRAVSVGFALSERTPSHPCHCWRRGPILAELSAPGLARSQPGWAVPVRYEPARQRSLPRIAQSKQGRSQNSCVLVDALLTFFARPLVRWSRRETVRPPKMTRFATARSAERFKTSGSKGLRTPSHIAIGALLPRSKEASLRSFECGRGGTGRRATLRSLWANARGSSSLLARTKFPSVR